MRQPLATFTFKSTLLPTGEAPIRAVEVNGEPWFVLANVCQVLELGDYKGSYAHHAYRLGESERRVILKSDIGISGKGRGVMFVSESGLYKLVMRSDKPQAKPFQNWVTQEVLPSIRKNGGYIAGQERLRSGEMFDLEFLARAQEVAGRVLAQVQEDNKRLLRLPIPPP